MHKEIDKNFLDYYKDKCDFTDEEFNIIMLSRKKLFIYQISQRLNISDGTIYNRLNDINRKLNDTIEKDVYAYKSQGLNNFEIAQRVGVTTTVIPKIINNIINSF